MRVEGRGAESAVAVAVVYQLEFNIVAPSCSLAESGLPETTLEMLAMLMQVMTINRFPLPA